MARLLAFAHEIERRIRAGELDDLARAARVFGLTRARVTQIVNLMLLAPEIQEAILGMLPVTVGRDPITERTLRPVVAEPVWERQASLWSTLGSTRGAAAAVGTRLSESCDILRVSRRGEHHGHRRE